MALTIASEVGTDWTAVAQNAVGESATIDISANYQTALLLQAGLDTTTAHDGTKFTVQVSQQSSGDEDWHDWYSFTALDGTATTDLIEDNPLAAGSTSLTLTAHTLTEEGIWILIEDSTLADSELIFVASQSVNAVVALDGTTNAHVLNTPVYNIAISKVITVPMGTGMRARLIVDNTYDSAGSSLNYKLGVVETTAI